MTLEGSGPEEVPNWENGSGPGVMVPDVLIWVCLAPDLGPVCWQGADLGAC